VLVGEKGYRESGDWITHNETTVALVAGSLCQRIVTFVSLFGALLLDSRA
jgi:hypothetical protein